MTSSPARARVLATSLVVLAVVTVCVQVFAVRSGTGDKGYVVAKALVAPVLGAVLAVGLALGGYFAWTRGRRAAWVAVVAALAVAVGLFAVRSHLSATIEHDRRLASPDGVRSLVIDAVPSILEPRWELSIETNDGIRSRYERVGCVDGDVREITGARWITDTEATIDLTDGAAARIRLDPDGHARPDPSLAQACATD